jgi:hypothetical protein
LPAAFGVTSLNELSRSSKAVALVAFGALVLFLMPPARLLLLRWGLGMESLTTLLILEGMVLLARALSPLRATAWFQVAQAEEPGLGMRLVTMELALSAISIAILTVTGRWWQPLLGVTAPMWMLVLLAVSAAGHSVMFGMARLKRFSAMFLSGLDMMIIVPLVVMFTSSLGTLLFVSTTMTMMITGVVLASSPTTDEDWERFGRKGTEERVDRWNLGTWLQTLEQKLRRPWFVILAGSAFVVPFAAVISIGGVLALPVFAIAVGGESARKSSIVARALRGVLLAGAGVLFVRLAGPPLYRALFPAELGDGAWLEILAWTNLAAIPFALQGVRKHSSHTSQARTGLAAAISIGLLLVLGHLHGIHGFLWAIALGPTIMATLKTVHSSTDAQLSD